MVSFCPRFGVKRLSAQTRESVRLTKNSLEAVESPRAHYGFLPAWCFCLLLLMLRSFVVRSTSPVGTCQLEETTRDKIALEHKTLELPVGGTRF